jgi:caa(3)-type oxidase subunit IV
MSDETTQPEAGETPRAERPAAVETSPAAETAPAAAPMAAVWAAARASHADTPAPQAARPLLSSLIDETPDKNGTIVLGRTVHMPMYTVVFATLAVITLVEVIISELPEGLLGTLSLALLSLIKAVLVVLFYMHLRNDSRIFIIALILPIVVSIIATMFLLAVPTTGY